MVRISIKNATVKVMPFAGYRNKYVGETGVVEKEYLANRYSKTEKIGVRLDNRTNSASATGVFWFDADKLEIIDNYETEEAEIMLKGFKVAGISFLEGTNTGCVYAYALYDESITVDDIVVVQTGHHGLAVAKVVDIDAPGIGTDSVKHGREVIAKVDFTAFNERKEKAARLAKLKVEMDRKVEELQNVAIYELLAEKDTALKDMLDEFKALSAIEV